jgi:hypothetical protein
MIGATRRRPESWGKSLNLQILFQHATVPIAVMGTNASDVGSRTRRFGGA